VFEKNIDFWEQYKIGQCIILYLFEMSRNESLLIAASYFWSDAFNAFLFGHGPMTPTLADVLLQTSLDVSSSDALFGHRNDKPSHHLKTKNVGGWFGYIVEHMKEGTIKNRGHVAFLNMWLEKFVCCGKSFGPTYNYQMKLNGWLTILVSLLANISWVQFIISFIKWQLVCRPITQ
jgi:hypothetical protein